ncbi:MAG: DoxX family protein [Flavobacteriales bacterium]|nr:DoxX family protein [Flavobacteriales bacterium]
MKILVYISRIFVGALFIVSGLIKANDTLGFSYKLEEYFENGALAYRMRDWFGWDSFSLEFFIEYALLLAVIMCAAEIILGFAILFGTKIKFAVFSLLGLTIMFFFLTLHTATCDPFASYDEVTAVEVDSPEHIRFTNRMEENTKITIREETAKEVIFVEEMPVQCVTDCGCFGDAMKGSLGRSLTPWESWTKDLILMMFLIPIFLFRNRIKINVAKEDLIIGISSLVFVGILSWVFDWYFPILFFSVGYLGYYGTKRLLFNTVMRWIPIGVVTIITLVFIYYTLNHLPIRDYRAYAVDKSIPEQMVLPEGAVPDLFSNVFTYKDTVSGKVVDFYDTNGDTGEKLGYYIKEELADTFRLMSDAEIPWNIPTYIFVDRITELVKAGDKTPITDFTITSMEDGNDYSADYFNEEGYIFMFVAYDINKTDEASLKKINTFVDQSGADGNYFIGLTSSLYDDVEDFRHKNQTPFDFYSCDAITLKTIIRANPGIVLMKKGNILGKWNMSDLPDYKDVKIDYLK